MEKPKFEPGDVVYLKSTVVYGNMLYMTVSEVEDENTVMCIYLNPVTGKTEEESFPVVVLQKHGK